MPTSRNITAVGSDRNALSSVAKGFNSIVESIMMEAAEKCEEIDVKCDEEYQVLRRKEISEQGEVIEKMDKKRRQNVMKDDRVCYTKLINGFRLAQLRAKNDIFNNILATVKQRIASDSGNRYGKLLENCLTQALYMLMEPEVFITCRKTDQNLIASTFSTAARLYEKNTKLRISIAFSKKSLPDSSSAGGMFVSNRAESVTVNCSLDSRVDQVCHLAMPMIVEMLFAGVPVMKESPKLSLQKALSPTSSKQPVAPKKNSAEGSERSMTPESHKLLKEERSGVGSSTIHVLGPNRESPDDHHSDDHVDGENDPAGAKERRSTTKSADSKSSEPDSGAHRNSSAAAPGDRKDKRPSSDKK